ncbi:MAG TPA: SAM-dependent methyltransferase [Kiritimatiellia bacterium]|nr:SAM-dependent methyltransferase [Kiritimatiellia bacterium]HMP33920.1 SAM-dependent methyltransferase [Kiritimatiellia bacterium]
MSHPATKPACTFVCRPEFTDALIEEGRDKCGPSGHWSAPAPGLVELCGVAPPARQLVFERQRLMAPFLVPMDELKPLSDATAVRMLGTAATEKPLWTAHLLTVDDDNEAAAGTSLPKRLEGIWGAAVRLARKTAPDLEKRYRPPHRIKPDGTVIQVLLGRDGCRISHERAGAMVQTVPGGILRMKWDDAAPSRSYLKMEEAFAVMPVAPVAGERVIDLGAAPGGWTYAFVKRGCPVIAVDHGPMKLPPAQPGWGTVEHRRENGITFMPPRDGPAVDWLVGDMLIAPGVALGLLRRWLEPALARRIVCNIKLPQEQPYAAIKPVEALLAGQTRYTWIMRQLYHDRREITVMAWR